MAAFAQAAAALAVLAAAPFFPTRFVALGALAWGALSGVGSGMGTAFLYRALGAGQMSVVAPLSAVGAAVLPVLVGVVQGERPSWLAAAGIGIAMPAIWLVSRGSEAGTGGSATGAARQRAGLLGEGVADGMVAGAGFAVLFVALDRVPTGTGLWPIAAGQVVSVLAVLCLAIPGRVSLRLPPRTVAGAAIVGCLGALGTILYMFATRQQLLAVAAVLTSLYPAVTIALARVVLRERATAGQAVGIVAAGAAVTLIALG